MQQGYQGQGQGRSRTEGQRMVEGAAMRGVAIATLMALLFWCVVIMLYALAS